MKKIALTVGDPCGIGPEIIRAWISQNPENASEIEVLAHADFLETLPKNIAKREIVADSKFVLGNPSESGAKLAFDALNAAAHGCTENIYSAVVTAPVSKFWMSKIDSNFVGQTEFFESRWGGEAVMCFAGERMILSLATWHIPFREVPSAINEKTLARACACASRLAQKIRKISNPKIAVCGLNPHAGEEGILGREEIEIINPILEKLLKIHPNLSRALPPDTVFNRLLKNEFDAAVALYHDQGLAPLKTVEFDTAVNISMNMPFIRTSPDHGTAFQIAGKNIASCSSLAHAIKLAKLLSS